MRSLRSNIFFLPICLFLLMVLSGLSIQIHHVHPLEPAQPRDTTQSHGHDENEPHQENPSTYHEVHYVKLLSDDSFNTSSRAGGISALVHFIVTIVPTIGEVSNPIASSSVSLLTQQHASLPAREKCALFCSYLI